MQENTDINALLCVDNQDPPAIRWLGFETQILRWVSNMIADNQPIGNLNLIAPIHANWQANGGDIDLLEEAEMRASKLRNVLTAIAGQYLPDIQSKLQLCVDSKPIAIKRSAQAADADPLLIEKAHRLTGNKLLDMGSRHCRGNYESHMSIGYLAAHYDHYGKPGVHLIPNSEEPFLEYINNPDLIEVMRQIYPDEAINPVNESMIVAMGSGKYPPYYPYDKNEIRLSDLNTQNLSVKGATQNIRGAVAEESKEQLQLLLMSLNIQAADQKEKNRLINVVDNSYHDR